MDAATRRRVRTRAKNRCEYCRLAQHHEPYAPFHVEHAIAKQHGGRDDDANLCLACTSCNLHKGPNIAGIDPVTRQLVRIYHPRKDDWHDHFAWRGALLVGKTPVGRATIVVLGINLRENVEHREALIAEGVFRE